MAWPDYSQEVDEVLGWPQEERSLYPAIAAIANVIVGSNPPYTVNDFGLMYPKFLGAPTVLTGVATVLNSPVVTLAAANTTLQPGQLVTGLGIPKGTYVLSINGTAVTLTQLATASNSISMNVYQATLLPLAVLNAFIMLASNSLASGRYLDMWTLVMDLFIAHYATLYHLTDGPQASATASAAASAGLARGIAVSKSIGDVSVSYQPVTGLDSWATWNLTTYGTQLATIAKAIGSAPMLIY